MAENTLIRINHELTAVDLGIGQDPSGEVGRGLRVLSEFLAAVSAGVRHAVVEVAPAAVKAVAEITFGSTDGNVTINGVNIAYTGADANARAANALAAINASVDALVAGHVVASAGSTAAKVYVTAVTPGIVGNTITLAVTGTGASVSSARLIGGAETGKKTYRKGM